MGGRAGSERDDSHIHDSGVSSAYRRVERDDATVRTDPATAHKAGGKGRLPESCWLCYATSLAEAEAAGRPPVEKEDVSG